MADSCPIIVQDGTAIMVDNAYDKYSAFATSAYNLAVTQVQNLGDFTLPVISPNVTFNIDDSVYGFNRPEAPILPVLVYNDPGTLPDAPSIETQTVTFDTAPADPGDLTPVISDYPEPAAVAPDAPVDLPTPKSVAYTPEQLTLTVADQPVLTLPTVPDADLLPPFTDIVAPRAPQVPGQNFAFTQTEYTSALLSKTSNQISVMLDGGTGLPAAVAQALRDRANAAVDVEEQRQVEQAYEEYASKGWEEPTGVLMKRVAAARQAAQNQRAAANRDIYVQEQTVALENLRFAVTQGVALETQLLSGHNEAMRIALEAARAVEDLSINLFNAQVGLYNGQQQANAILATIERDRGQQTLDLARLQLEASRARGELTEQQWVDGLRGLDLQATVYRANLEAMQASAASSTEDNRAGIERFRAELQLFSQTQGAYEAEWANWTRKWQTNDLRERVAELAASAYATRIKAWSETQNTKIAGANLGIAQNDQTLRVWRGQVDTMLAKYTAERDRLASLVSIAQAQVDMYRAQVGVETAASDVNLRLLLAALEREKERTDVALKNAELNINQVIENGRLLLSAKDTVARTSAQLAASSMSAVSFSAGIHSGLSQSYGCSTSFNYSGAIDTTTTP